MEYAYTIKPTCYPFSATDVVSNKSEELEYFCGANGISLVRHKQSKRVFGAFKTTCFEEGLTERFEERFFGDQSCIRAAQEEVFSLIQVQGKVIRFAMGTSGGMSLNWTSPRANTCRVLYFKEVHVWDENILDDNVHTCLE